jgi:hypothetical protein
MQRLLLYPKVRILRLCDNVSVASSVVLDVDRLPRPIQVVAHASGCCSGVSESPSLPDKLQAT